MSDAYAVERFQEAARRFQRLEKKLRGIAENVDPKTIDAVLIDLSAAIPGLSGEDLGRALVFKAHVLFWRFMVEPTKKTLYDPDDPIDPRLGEALDDARKGRAFLKADADLEWAGDVIKKLGG